MPQTPEPDMPPENNPEPAEPAPAEPRAEQVVRDDAPASVGEAPKDIATTGEAAEATQTLAEIPAEPEVVDLDTSSGLEWAIAGGLLMVLAAGGVVVARRLAGPTVMPVGGQRDSSPSVAAPGTPEVPEAPAPQPAAPTLASRFAQALSRTGGAFRDLFGRPVDEELLESLEEALLVADVGVRTSQRLIDRVRVAAKDDAGPGVLREALDLEMRAILDGVHVPLEVSSQKPYVLLVVGVNGSGKTTTIGKLASRFAAEGRKVLLGAADTYRAAAADQLAIWAERAGADLVRHEEGSDPGAVAYDTMQAALARGADVVLVDTAGRLQTRRPLMEQLSKIRRVIGKVVPDAPHGTLLVIDGTMGQNALSQAQLFDEATPLTGVAVTKLDGTAKGGVVLAVADQMGLPIQLVGVGEQVEDLRDFDPGAFVEAVLARPEAGTTAE